MKPLSVFFLGLTLATVLGLPKAAFAQEDDVSIWLSGRTLAQWANEKSARERAEVAAAAGAPEGPAAERAEDAAAGPDAAISEGTIDDVVIDILASRRRAGASASPARSVAAARPQRDLAGQLGLDSPAEIPRAWRPILATARNDGERALLAVLLVCGERLHQQRGIPVAATVAMALHESGYGHSSLASSHHNFFGMKARAFEVFVNLPTRELGKMVRAQFRSFSDLQAGIEGFGDFLQRPLYRRAFGRPLAYRAFVSTLLACGYCPEPDYLQCIDQIARRHRLDLLEPGAGRGGYGLAGPRSP